MIYDGNEMKQVRLFNRCGTAAIAIAAMAGPAAVVVGDAASTQPTSMPSTSPTTKPTLRLLSDGFPGGHDTPEGAACDLARAFIRRDAKLFRDTCAVPFGGGDGRKAYEDFLNDTEASIRTEAAKDAPSPHGPKVIGKVFAARHLSHDGPASYAYAAFGFSDVVFVDVGVIAYSGDPMLCRTLVIQDPAGKWFIDPDPAAHPLLCEGLNDERMSTQDVSEAYAIQK